MRSFGIQSAWWPHAPLHRPWHSAPAEYSDRLSPMNLHTLLACSMAFSSTSLPFPSHQTLATGPWAVRTLPGCEAFTFTLYGCPGELDTLKSLVEAMQTMGLGNGFDPGPAARAASKGLFDYLASVGWPVVCYPGCPDMQVAGGRCVLQSEDGAALAALDQKGIFNAVQLGEWGYYFGFGRGYANNNWISRCRKRRH